MRNRRFPPEEWERLLREVRNEGQSVEDGSLSMLYGFWDRAVQANLFARRRRNNAGRP